MLKQSTNENEIINNINEVLETQVNINLTSKQNISNIEKQQHTSILQAIV